jgi:hypothetical protein
MRGKKMIMNDSKRPINENIQNQKDYGSNVRLTDDPEPDDIANPADGEDTHQKLDNKSDIDQHQAYDEGRANAAEINPPKNQGIESFDSSQQQ